MNLLKRLYCFLFGHSYEYIDLCSGGYGYICVTCGEETDTMIEESYG